MQSTIITQLSRQFHTSCRIDRLKHHDDKLKLFWGRVTLHNKRHLRRHKVELNRRHFERPNKYNFPIYKYGTRSSGIRHDGFFEFVPEMIPEIIVPDLTDCKFKPYVSYRTKEITQEELTSKDLFNSVYGAKIVKDYKEGKIDEETGLSKEPSPEEKLTPHDAYIQARKTGSDIFQGGIPVDLKWKLEYKE